MFLKKKARLNWEYLKTKTKQSIFSFENSENKQQILWYLGEV